MVGINTRFSLVTGGAGFIGSHLVKALLTRGDRVRVVDNFSTGKRENLANLTGTLEVIEGDIRDASQMARAMDGIDIVFHQAAFVSVPQSIQDPQTCFSVNVAGAQCVLEAARAAGVQQIVLASSTAVYGDSEVLPVQEALNPKPLSPYALSKQVNEQYARLYSQVFNLPVVALRYFNVYGPRQSPKSEYAAVIPIFIDRLLADQPVTIYGDGYQVRDFIFVEDVVEANLLAAENRTAAGESFNVCTGEPVNLNDLVATLRDVIQIESQPIYDPPRPGDIYRSYGDPRHAAQILGFQARTSLRSGLEKTVDWLRQERRNANP